MIDYNKFIGDLSNYRNPSRDIPFIPLPDPRNRDGWTRARHDLALTGSSARQFVVQDHIKFANYFNAQSETARIGIELVRPYWLGSSAPIAQPLFATAQDALSFVGQLLIADIIDMTLCYRLNYDRTPGPTLRRAQRSVKGHKPRPYREWFATHYGRSTYTAPLVEALASGADLKLCRSLIPAEATLWGFTGAVLSDAELKSCWEGVNEPGAKPRNFTSVLNPAASATVEASLSADQQRLHELQVQISALQQGNDELLAKLEALMNRDHSLGED